MNFASRCLLSDICSKKRISLLQREALDFQVPTSLGSEIIIELSDDAIVVECHVFWEWFYDEKYLSQFFALSASLDVEFSEFN